MAKPDHFDGTGRALYHQIEEFNHDDLPALVDQDTKAIKEYMKAFRDGLFAPYEKIPGMNQSSWISLIRIECPNNHDGQDASPTDPASYKKDFHIVRNIAHPKKDYLTPEAQTIKRQMVAQLNKKLNELASQYVGANRDEWKATIRVAKLQVGTTDQWDEGCGCGCHLDV